MSPKASMEIFEAASMPEGSRENERSPEGAAEHPQTPPAERAADVQLAVQDALAETVGDERAVTEYASKRGSPLSPDESALNASITEDVRGAADQLQSDTMRLLPPKERAGLFAALKKRASKAGRAMLTAVALHAAPIATEQSPRNEDAAVPQRTEMPAVAKAEQMQTPADAAAPEIPLAVPKTAQVKKRGHSSDLLGAMRAAAAKDAQALEAKRLHPPTDGPIAALPEGASVVHRAADAAVFALDEARGVYAVTDGKTGEIHQFISTPEKAAEYGANFVQLDKPAKQLVTAFRNADRKLERQGLKALADGSYGEAVPGSELPGTDGSSTHLEVRPVFDAAGNLTGIMEWNVSSGPGAKEPSATLVKPGDTAADGSPAKFDQYRELLNLEDVPTADTPTPDALNVQAADLPQKMDGFYEKFVVQKDAAKDQRAELRNGVAKRIDGEQAAKVRRQLQDL